MVMWYALSDVSSGYDGYSGYYGYHGYIVYFKEVKIPPTEMIWLL